MPTTPTPPPPSSATPTSGPLRVTRWPPGHDGPWRDDSVTIPCPIGGPLLRPAGRRRGPSQCLGRRRRHRPSGGCMAKQEGRTLGGADAKSPRFPRRSRRRPTRRARGPCRSVPRLADGTSASNGARTATCAVAASVQAVPVPTAPNRWPWPTSSLRKGKGGAHERPPPYPGQMRTRTPLGVATSRQQPRANEHEPCQPTGNGCRERGSPPVCRSGRSLPATTVRNEAYAHE